MDETTIRLTFGLAGLVVGLVIGWTSRAARDARVVRRELMNNGNDDTASKRSWYDRWWRDLNRSDAVLGGVILVTLLATLVAWRVDARVDRVVDCNRDTTHDLIARELWTAQRDFLDTVSDPTATEAEEAQALIDYQTELSDFIDGFPSAEEIRECEERVN